MIQSKVTIRGSQRFTSDETNSTLVIAVTHESLPSWVKAILCKPAFPLVSQKNQTDPPNIEINWSCDKSMRLHGLTPTKMTWCVQKKTNKEIYWQILCVSVFWTVCVCVCVYIYACVFQHQEQGQLQECVSAVRVCLTRLDHVIKVHETNQPPFTPLLLSPFFALLLLLPSFPHHCSSFLSLLLFTLNLSSSLSLPLIFCSVRLVLAHYWSSWLAVLL